MKYKIIACDMDETLLSSDATICRRNIEAITAAIAKGVKFVPCTGRGFRSIEGVLRTLGLYDQADQYVIGFNGALIALGVTGFLPPATSATLHNLSTLGVSLRSMGRLTAQTQSARGNNSHNG